MRLVVVSQKVLPPGQVLCQKLEERKKKVFIVPKTLSNFYYSLLSKVNFWVCFKSVVAKEQLGLLCSLGVEVKTTSPWTGRRRKIG